ncbi:MAG: hypothetical protein ACYTXA_18110 [Nostoc sp.]
MQKGDPDTHAAALLAKIKAEKQQAMLMENSNKKNPSPKSRPMKSHFLYLPTAP